MCKKITAEKLHRRENRKRTMLRKLRLSYGLTMQAVATQMNVDQSYMSILEAGKRKPSLDVAQRLAKCYETTVEELFP